MDLPQDKPTTPDAPASHRPAVPTADQVAAYLSQHPDFLIDHPELLSILSPPRVDRGERVVDMQHFMVQHQRNEIAQIKALQKDIVSASRANQAVQARVHAAVLAIISARTFEQLIQTVTTDLANLLDADVVTIAVEQQGGQRTKLPHQGVEILQPGTVAEVLGPERDIVLQTETEGDPRLFGAGAGLVRSAALARLPVSANAPAGMLCIGTRKPGKFQAGQGTELLSFLARVLGITIAAWLDLPA